MISLTDIALRLGLAFVAGVVIGINRESQGRAAGLRTMILVCVAGALSIIVAQYWIGPQTFDASASRVAQGMVTGVGFLGAGSIIKEGMVIRGITTAATLWMVTVIGLAFGAGELALGGIALGVVLLTLTVLAVVEHHVLYDWNSQMSVVVDAKGPSEADLYNSISQFDAKIEVSRRGFDVERSQREMMFKIRTRRGDEPGVSQKILNRLCEFPGVVQVNWSN
jgi:putative Mg2+ transporter-C (MgtC) family protein